jgi:hypothetical protein
MNPKILAAAVTALAFALPAGAQTATPRVDQRQANQDKRIDQGVQSGELNSKEAARLENGQNKVERMEDRAKADGTVTKKEKGALHHAQEKQSKRIFRQKHDAQKAIPAANSPG